ncbi:MAG: exodeoxyribonuclease V subunit gamma [Lautropia sp.]|nr:exodeoxyribonuclease V subunit gamma [Lautropia sp.]
MADLNPTQSQAVRHLDGPSLVIAGAGSGKTRVITAKLGHLIDAGYQGRTIAAITFTNKAATEMAERFGQQRKLKASERPTISTFHSLGMKMLRTSGRAIGLKPSFSIFDADDCAGLLTQLLQTTDRKLVKLAMAKISLWKNALTEPEVALKQARGESELRIARAFMEYQATLEGYQAVDFDDLIRLPLKLLRTDEEARRYWHDRLRYFLVDEYQDTNAAQYALLKELVGDRHGLTAVGDDDQSIYGWRGATLENLKRLGQDFPNLTVIKLEQNYRSTRAILDAANTLIARNPKLYAKTLWSSLGLGDPLKVIACDDDEDEAEKIVMRIKVARFERNLTWSDFAILYRGNHQARVVEQMLRKERIPYQISGGQSFFDRAEIKDLCAYLRLLANNDDDPAFIRAATTPRRGIGPQTLKLLGEYAGERDISLFQALFEAGIETRIPERQLYPLRTFGEFINKLRWRAEREPASDMLNALIKSIDYEAYLMEQGDERSATTRWQYVCEFRDWIGRRADEDGKTLIDMAQHISLVTRLEGRDEEMDGVKLSTVHASKGLEYPHVYLIGVEEGLMPHAGREEDGLDDVGGMPVDRDKIDTERLEEERRLMYVAITRARRSLTLSWCRQRKRARQMVECQPSRFITEMQLDAEARNNTPVSADEAKKKLAALRAMLAGDA